MSKLAQAIEAIKAGDKTTGQRLLREVLQTDPANESAWFWMTRTVDSDQKRLRCLEKVLEINPANEPAQRGIATIQKRMKPQPKNRYPWWLFAGAALLLVCCICPMLYGLADSTMRQVGLLPTQTPRPTATATATAEPPTTPTFTPGPPTDTPGPTATPTPDIGNEGLATVMCHDFVRKHLKAPSSADFGGLFEDWDQAVFVPAEDAEVYGIDIDSLINSGIWVVRGEVDAQNSFGVMLRNQYICVMDYSSALDTWYLLDISITD
jgi:hypothetical protein